MIEALKPYAEYKEWGVLWLGRCPNHWKLKRTKILFHERVEKGYPDEPLLAATQSKGVVKKEDYEIRTVTAQKDLHLLKLVEAGDYVISLRSFQGGIEYSHCRGIISPAYTVLKPSMEAEGGFYTHFFKSWSFIDSLTLFVTGIREGQNIDYGRLSRAELPVPPKDEQVAIVRFLDQANRKIDRVTRDKRRLIKLLNEQKHAIIHRAVTRGLDPNVQLKPSGIDWLGDVPEHWEVKKLKWIAQFNPSKSVIAKNLKSDDRVVFLPMERVGTDGQIDVSEYKTVAEVWEGFTHFSRNDVVVAKITPCFENGKGAYLGNLPTEYGFGTTEFIVLRANQQINPEYLYLLTTLKKLRKLGADNMIGAAGQKRVPLEFLRHFVVPVPPVVEQRSILNSLSLETKRLAQIIDRTRREIDLISEYRTRLISDVVTGKLDVRGVELPATDEAEVLEDIEIDEDTESEELIESEEVADDE